MKKVTREKVLQLPLKCGEGTCASEPGHFCPYVCVQRFGTIFICGVFNTELEYKRGWLQRCQECLKHEVQVTKKSIRH